MSKHTTVARFVKYILKSDWAPLLTDYLYDHAGDICEARGIDPDELVKILGIDAADLVFQVALEDFMTCDDVDGNPVNDYLRRKGFAETATSKRYLEALRDSKMSLYEVSEVVPGKSFLARDLIYGGEPILVLEQLGTSQIKQWDRIGCRILKLGSEYRMSAGILPFDSHAARYLIHLYTGDAAEVAASVNEHLRSSGQTGLTGDTERQLAEARSPSQRPAMFVKVWLSSALQDVLEPRLPDLVNHDGDPIAFCKSEFSVLPSASDDAISRVLASVPGVDLVAEGKFNWVRSGFNGSGKLEAEDDNGDTILGSILIEKGRIELVTNSSNRLIAGEAMLVKALAGLVGEPERTEKSVAELLQEMPAAIDGVEADGNLIDPAVTAALDQILDRHYRKTLDEPVPALGNITPRAASKTKAGREKLVAWLKDLENSAAQDRAVSLPGYDFTWMWQELGVAERRV